MISPAHTQAMARYNTWQNQSIYNAANTLSHADRGQDRGAFWQSIHGTLKHVLWGDQLWMSRFSDLPAPAATNEPLSSYDLATWDGLKRTRVEFDQTIEAWTAGLTDAGLQGNMTWYSGLSDKEMTKPRWYLVTHFFNHQTHHRGQVHCMLTQAGAKPGDTDMPFVPD